MPRKKSQSLVEFFLEEVTRSFEENLDNLPILEGMTDAEKAGVKQAFSMAMTKTILKIYKKERETKTVFKRDPKTNYKSKS